MKISLVGFYSAQILINLLNLLKNKLNKLIKK